MSEKKFPDNYPLIRTDAFDCVTFVETSIANGDLNKLNKIRYKEGVKNFENRNHFMSTDWFKNNSDLVYNISGLFGKVDVRAVSINKKNWFKKQHNLTTDFDIQIANIEYIPYTNLNDFNSKETVLIAFIINNQKMYDKIGTDLAINHVGFLLPNGKFRHASSSFGKVIDVDFKKYIQKRAKNKNELGIAIYRIKNDR